MTDNNDAPPPPPMGTLSPETLAMIAAITTAALRPQNQPPGQPPPPVVPPFTGAGATSEFGALGAMHGIGWLVRDSTPPATTNGTRKRYSPRTIIMTACLRRLKPPLVSARVRACPLPPSPLHFHPHLSPYPSPSPPSSSTP
ncbi:hypothetical protein B0H14DRAFT_3482728 [Mycena olivaceomarginata]|nr:hypothetical protein B0H14DRAFT_3482728 [Mycena olivaceomarginata]